VTAGQRDSTVNGLPGCATPSTCGTSLMDRRRARQRATFCIGDVWVRGGTVNCRTRAIREREGGQAYG
jgi:hypothetical protein